MESNRDQISFLKDLCAEINSSNGKLSSKTVAILYKDEYIHNPDFKNFILSEIVPYLKDEEILQLTTSILEAKNAHEKNNENNIINYRYFTNTVDGKETLSLEGALYAECINRYQCKEDIEKYCEDIKKNKDSYEKLPQEIKSLQDKLGSYFQAYQENKKPKFEDQIKSQILAVPSAATIGVLNKSGQEIKPFSKLDESTWTKTIIKDAFRHTPIERQKSEPGLKRLSAFNEAISSQTHLKSLLASIDSMKSQLEKSKHKNELDILLGKINVIEMKSDRAIDKCKQIIALLKTARDNQKIKYEKGIKSIFFWRKNFDDLMKDEKSKTYKYPRLLNNISKEYEQTLDQLQKEFQSQVSNYKKT